VPFWERLLREIRETDPDVLFLAEAFTRPPMMQTLAKIGFHQSYTYFTWRNTRQELEEYLTELSRDSIDYLRPNFFVNTPDILHAYLQHGGPPAFKVRAVVAAMSSPTWGVYSGFELFENTPVREGSEEYLDSEKYQYRPRDWVAAERVGRSLAPFIATLNRLRREHPSLHWLRNLHFHRCDNPQIMVFSKRCEGDTVVTVVNLDPHHTQEATVSLDMPALGADWGDRIALREELTGVHWTWSQSAYVRLDPFIEPAHILTIVAG
jgi:starch synthase (maltosyl-transferring)